MHGPFVAVDSGANGGERVPPDEAKHLHEHLPGALVLWRRKGLLWHWHPQKAAAHCSSQDAVEAVDRNANVKPSLPKASTSGSMGSNTSRQYSHSMNPHEQVLCGEVADRVQPHHSECSVSVLQPGGHSTHMLLRHIQQPIGERIIQLCITQGLTASSDLASGSQPSCGFHMRSCSAGTFPFTSSVCCLKAFTQFSFDRSPAHRCRLGASQDHLL